MEPFRTELLEVLAAQQPAFTDFIVNIDALPVPGGLQYSKDELRQMVIGFFALVREAIEGTSRELRDMYMATVFPGLRASGSDAKSMITGSARTLIHIQHELVSRVSEANRVQARDWLTNYFAEYLGDMAQVWER